MEKGKTVEVHIDDITQEGAGVGRAEDGRAIFVRGAVPGDRVLAEVTKLKKRYAVGRLIEVAEPSPSRRETFCEYAGPCGGCPYGELQYPAQLELKQQHVKDALQRIGGIREPLVRPIIGAAEPERYRNKAVLQIAGAFAHSKIGFYRAGTHDVCDCRDCRIQMPPAAACAEALRRFMKEDNIASFDRRTGKGLLKGMTVRTARGTGEVMVVLVINGKGIPNSQKLVDLLDDAVWSLPPDEDGREYSLESVFVNISRDAREQYGKKTELLAGRDVIREEIGGVRFEISPTAFYQVNPLMMEKLYDQVLEYADLKSGSRVLDLYCGAGSIGLWLAHAMDGKIHLLGIESNQEAVRQANRNAVINGIVDARYIAGKAETVLPELMRRSSECDSEDPEDLTRIRFDGADVVILDPPRAGCQEALLDAACETGAERIIYVSCDPPTLARDAKFLLSKGYSLVETVPVDMFPNTGHVETVCLLSRKK